jgi:hypothetical protein
MTTPRQKRNLSQTRTADYLRAPWSPAEDAQLGTAPDSAIAERLGRSRGSVVARRHYLGIPSPRKVGRPWPATTGAGGKPSNSEQSRSLTD